jgi:HEAT repeat protein
MKRFVTFAVIALALGACGTRPGYQAEEREFLEAPTFLEAEIQDRIANLEYLSEEELYQNIVRLVYIGEAAIPYMIEGLSHESARVRGSCAYVFGILRDRRTIEPLRECLDDPVPGVRYEAATALCAMGVRDGYSTLVEGLSDKDIRNRYKAHEALVLLTRLDFGYHHDDDPEVRRTAVLHWEEWLARMNEEPL